MSASHSIWQYPDFQRLTLARFLFVLAVQVQSVAIGWQVYLLTKDPLMLGMVGLIEAIPAIGLALFAGLVVDRGRPLQIYKGVMLVSLASLALLLFCKNTTTVYLFFAASFLSGIARGFASPSVYSMVAKFIPREALNASSAWLTLAMQIAVVVGPAISGLCLALWGSHLTFQVSAIILVFAILSLVLIKTNPGKNIPFDHNESLSKKLSSGINYVFNHPILLSALSLDMFAVLFGGVTALLPIFASEILMSGPKSLGYLRSAPAIGALFGSFFLIRFQITKYAGTILLWSVAIFGITMIGFALSTNLIMACLFLVLSGFVDAISMVIRGAAVQLSSPDHLRGRIAAVNSIFIGSSNELGAFESGVAAKFLGTIPSVVFGGIMTLLVVLIVTLNAPALRNMDLSKIDKT